MCVKSCCLTSVTRDAPHPREARRENIVSLSRQQPHALARHNTRGNPFGHSASLSLCPHTRFRR